MSEDQEEGQGQLDLALADPEDGNDASVEEREFGADLYKKFYRGRAGGGFLTLRPWMEAGKVSIDVGAVTAEGKLRSSTVVWANLIDLAVYLRSVTTGVGARLYPVNARAGLPTEEAFASYGGDAAKAVARVLKIHHWESGPGVFNDGAFAWKTGHFKGKVTATGAIIPDMAAVLSRDMIQVSRTEMATISYRVDLAISAYAASTPEWMEHFNGKRR